MGAVSAAKEAGDDCFGPHTYRVIENWLLGPGPRPAPLTSTPTPPAASVASSAVMSTAITATLLLFKHQQVGTVWWGWGRVWPCY